jgi:UDP-3-O-acyl-N-acetylglucosamine deacetylase
VQTASTIELELRGRGLHTGTDSAIRFHPRSPDGKGLRFFWPDGPLTPEALGHWDRRVKRSTELRWQNSSIRTPEHLLAAALFFADCALDIHCDAEEPPGLDGSAKPFFELLSQAAPEAVFAPGWRTFPSQLSWSYEGPEGSLQAEPAADFSVEYELDRFPLREHFGLSDPMTATQEILPARTFIFYREWCSAVQAPGLLQGVGSESGLLITESQAEYEEAKTAFPELRGLGFPLLHPQRFRMDQEPVKHKILDLLGDLALLGLALPRLRLRIRNGGHALNHLLLERLQHERKQNTCS